VFKIKVRCQQGGNITGIARKELEKEIGKSVVTKNNFLPKSRNRLS